REDRADLVLEPARGLPPPRRQLRRDLLERFAGCGFLLLERATLELAAVQEVQLSPRAAPGLEDIRERRSVLRLQAEDQVLAAPDLIEPGRVVLDPGAVFAHPPPELLEVVVSALQEFDSIALGGVDPDELLEDASQFAEPGSGRVLGRVERLMQSPGQAGQILGVLEPVRLLLERLLLALLQLRPLDLLGLEAEEIGAL